MQSREKERAHERDHRGRPTRQQIAEDDRPHQLLRCTRSSRSARCCPACRPSVLLLLVAFVLDLVKRDEPPAPGRSRTSAGASAACCGPAALYLITLPLWLLLFVPGLDRLGDRSRSGSSTASSRGWLNLNDRTRRCRPERGVHDEPRPELHLLQDRRRRRSRAARPTRTTSCSSSTTSRPGRRCTCW